MAINLAMFNQVAPTAGIMLIVVAVFLIGKSIYHFIKYGELE